jgi:enamine deaminase RidA (YjgF/YER057c/UK114 family)
MSTVAQRLAALGLTIPQAAVPVANYVPYCRVGDMVHVSGQLSLDSGGGVRGTVGVDVDAEQARRAARLCAVNLIAQFRAACEGDLERVAQVVKLGAFVQAGPDFVAIPDVVNGCSDLMVEVFGEKGRHARSAVGVYRLPLGFAVEVDAVIRII